MTPVRTVLNIYLPRRSPPGREQHGARPAVVVADADGVGRARFPMLTVVPLTTALGPWVGPGGLLYPRFGAGVGGLGFESVALIDQLTDLDPARILGRLGSLTETEFDPLRAGLRVLLGEALGLEPKEEEAEEAPEEEAP